MDRNFSRESKRRAFVALAFKGLLIRKVNVDGVDRLNPGRDGAKQSLLPTILVHAEVVSVIVSVAWSPQRRG